MTESKPIAGARLLLRQCRFASLATLLPDGAPFVSLVAVATDATGRPILLLSDLARHSANIAADARVSLLFDGSGERSERLTGSRLTLTGTLLRCECDGELKRWYLAQHPGAEMLLGMADFQFYRMQPDQGHKVAGFGRIDAIDVQSLLVAPGLAEDLAMIEAGAIEHMLEDHEDALVLMAGTDDSASLVAIDADGIALVAKGQPVRVMFSKRLESASELRTAVAKVVRQICNKLD